MALAGSWSDVGGAHIQAFTFSSQDHGRLSGVCGGVCGGVVVVLCVWCVVKLGTLSLSLALSPSSSLSLSFSLLSFFFSLLFLFLLLLLLLLLLRFFFLFLFFLPFYSLFSSLPFTPTNTVQSTDQQTWRPTLRRLNVMWRTVRS